MSAVLKTADTLTKCETFSQTGKSYTTNQNRRIKLGARVNASRYKLRKHQLVAFLEKHEMMPSKELFQLDAVALYGLRSKAIKEQISLQESGTVKNYE